ncbi:MAG: adenosylcobinamide-GDP ribazoletransferase [Thermoplasmata archaeon]
MFKALKAAFSFFTIIPTRDPAFTPDMIAYIPLTGIMGGLIAAVIYFFTYDSSRYFASILAILSILIFNGLNHVDGVIDTGDALMVRDPVRRKEVIKDHCTGSGGLFAFFSVYFVPIVALFSFSRIIGSAVIFAAEITAKSVIMISLYNSKPFTEGLGKIFIEFFSKRKITYAFEAVIIPLIVSCIFSIEMLIPLALTFVIAALIKKRISGIFNGINGDILGFIGELSRMIFILVALFIFFYIRTSTFDIFSNISSSLVSYGIGLSSLMK